MTGLPQTRLVVLGLIAGLGTLAGVAGAQPVNDNFANATVLTGTFGTVTEDNSTATTEPGEPKHAGVLKNASIWFQWKAPANGEVTMDTLGSAVSTTFFGQTTTTYLDTVLAVYTGSDLSHLTQVAANDDQMPNAALMYKDGLYDGVNSFGGGGGGGGLGGAVGSAPYSQFPAGPSLLRFTAVSNTVYHIVVDSKPGFLGNLTLNWAYHSSGTFRFATEQFDLTTGLPEYVCGDAESETLDWSGDLNDTTTQSYYSYGVPGVLVTVTRVGGAAGRVLVDYTTADGTATTNLTGFGQSGGSDYTNVTGTLVFDDNEMTKSIVVPITIKETPGRGVWGRNTRRPESYYFNVILSNPRLDPGESPALQPPRLDPVMGSNAIVRIMDLYAPYGYGQNSGGYHSGIFYNPKSNVGPVQDYFSFQRAHYRVPRDYNNYYKDVIVYVYRYQNPDNTNNPAGATVNYAINNYLSSGGGKEEWDNTFALQPGSDYAIPTSGDNNPPYLQPAYNDFVLTAGSLSFPATGAGAEYQPIRFQIPNNLIPEFNKDFKITIWMDDSGARAMPGSVSEAIVTILFDDANPPAGSVDEFYNPDHTYDMATPLPVTSDPPDLDQPGADNQVMSLLVMTNALYFTNTVVLTNSSGTVTTNIVVTTQSNDELLIAGDFLSYNTYARNRLALVDMTGFLDAGFDPGDGPNDFVDAVTPASTGGYLIGGGFSSYQSAQRNGVALIKANGDLDRSFDPGFGANGAIRTVVALPNGQYLVAGDFTTFNQTNSSHLARLNADGSLDTVFSANAPTFVGNSIYAMVVNSAGRIYVAGDFSSVGGRTTASIACLNGNGSLYGTFATSVGSGLNGKAFALALDQNGQVLVGGAFSMVGAVPRTRLARLTPNGAIDYSFDPGSGPDDTVYTITPQADGTIYVGGQFTSYNGTHRLGLTRLFQDGSVDTSFLDSAYNQFAGLHRYRFADPAGVVYATAVQSDGKVFIGGSFGQVGGGQADPLIRMDPFNYQLDANGVSVEIDYTNNVWTEPKVREGLRNRMNVARLIAGSTPGPGNLTLTYTNYNVNKSQSSLTVSMNRTNGNLGYMSANFSVPPGVAQSGVDYNYFGAGPLFDVVWGALYYFPTTIANKGARAFEDGMFGTNTAPIDPWGIYYNQYIPGRLLVTTAKNSFSGNRQAQFQLANPAGADQFFLGGANIPLGVALGHSAAPFTVVDDTHKAGTIGFAQATYTVNEGDGTATINVARTNGSSGTVSIYYTTTPGTNVVIGTDYTPVNGTLTFAAGVTNASFTVPIIDNTIIQPYDRMVGLNLSAPGGGALLGNANADLYIIDNDWPLGYVKFDATAYSTNESAGSLVATVTRVGSSRGVISVLCSSTNSGTAVSGIDYVSLSTNLTWASGDASPRYVVLPLLNNQLVGADKTLGLVLSNPIGYGTNAPTILAGSRSSAAVTIHNDNLYGTLQFSATNYTVNENGGYATITVIRSGGSSQSLSVNYATSDGPNTYYQGEGIQPNYVLTTGTLNFQPGQVAASFTVPLLDDGATNVAGLYFFVSLSGLVPSTATLGFPSTATVTMIDAESVYAPPGTPDPNFVTAVPGFNGDILGLQIQTNGQVVVGGSFTTTSGVSRNRIARVNSDGTLDAGFLAGLSGASGTVNATLVQSDGNVVIGGAFTNINGLARNYIARLLTDGTSDQSFSPGVGADGPVYSLAESFVGGGTVRQLLVGGSFTYFNSLPHTSILRLNSNGGLDATFNPALDGGSTVYAIAVYPSSTIPNAGKILIGGNFSTVNGYARKGVARLNADGSLDTTFDPGLGATNAVRALALQLDGRIVLGGSFTYFNGQPYNHLVRLNTDGTLDSAFNVGVGTDDTVNALALQADERIVVAGSFTRASGVSRSRITRLLPDGTVDPSINFGLGANNYINSLAIQPDGMLVIGGGFTQYNGQPRSHLARIFGGSMAGVGSLTFLSANFQADENSTNTVVTVRRMGGTAGSVSINFATSDGTGANAALAGVNYSNVATTLWFPNGETFQLVRVPLIQDFKITPDLVANLTLSTPGNGAALGDQYLANLIIFNDDSSVSFAATNFAYAQNIASGSAQITLTRQGSSRITSAIDFFTTTNGTAIAGRDYLAVSNTFVFPVGQSNASVYVPLINDPTMLNSTTVDMRLTNAVNTLVFNPVEATLNILSTNQAAGQFVLSQTNFVVSEDSGVVAITILRTNGFTGQVGVNFATSSGTNANSAVAGFNYVPTNGVVSFADGELSKTIYVTLLVPNQVQGTTVFTVGLSNPSGGASLVPPTAATIYLLDIHQAVGLRDPVYVTNETSGSVVLTLDRVGPNTDTITVQYGTADGTAIAGVNYTTSGGLITFIPGETTKSLSIPILYDTNVTGSVSFNVNLSNPTDTSNPAGTVALYPHASALINLLDADAGIAFSTNFFGVLKSGTNVVISVTRSNANTGIVSVNFGTTTNGFNTNSLAIGSGPAVAGQDYYPVSGTLIFSNGVALQTFSIPIINNSVIEGNRSFLVTLSITNAATIGTPQLLIPATALVTITDDVSGLSFSSPAYQVNENGNHAVIGVLRTGYTNSSVTVDYATVAGTNANSAIAGVHYYPTNGTLVFTNGQTALSFAVPVLDNNRVDGDHILQLDLSRPLLTNSAVGFAVLTAPSASTLTISEADGSEILAAGAALTFTKTFANPNPMSLTGVNGANSIIPVTNLTSQVEKVVVHVPSVTTPVAQDLALMLTGPTGGMVGLAGNAGSGALAAASLSFDDWATTALPQNSVITNGNYLPMFYGSLPSFGLTNVPASNTNLGSFADSLPFGNWTLYAADDTAPYSGSLASGWSLDLTCLETNAARLIQPGETVTMLFAFRNGAGTNVNNLSATLLATNGVANPSAPQVYGPLARNGSSVSRLFTFTATGTNGQNISPQFHLQDGSHELNDVVFNFILGAGTVTFSNPAPIFINDNAAASPYPAQIVVGGVGNLVTKITATLTNLAHTYPADIDILLMSPTGQKSYLMAKTGSSHSITNVTVTFDDAAATALSTAAITNGSYQPTSLAGPTPAFPPTSTPVGPYMTNLTTFVGNNPNGTWSLFVYDDTPLNSGIISNGWFLTLTTSTPLPATADVGVAVTASSDTVIATSNVTFTVTVVNYGPGVANNVVVTNLVPAGVPFSASSGFLATNAAGQAVWVWNVGTMLKGAQASLAFTLWPPTSGPAVFVSAVSSGTSDLNPADDQASAWVTVIDPSADLALGLTSVPNLVAMGQVYSLVATIANAGPATATAVQLSLMLDPNVVLVSTMPSAGPPVNGLLTFTNLGNLGSNQSTNVTVWVRSTVNSGFNSAFGTCSSSVIDPAKANNDNSVKTLVGVPRLQFQLTGNNMVLSWPASLGRYNLQSATNLVPPVTWTVSTNAPVAVGSDYFYTNPAGSGTLFFRLNGPTP